MVYVAKVLNFSLHICKGDIMVAEEEMSPFQRTFQMNRSYVQLGEVILEIQGSTISYLLKSWIY